MDWPFIALFILTQTATLVFLACVCFHILLGALAQTPTPRRTDQPLPKLSPSDPLKRKTADLIARDRNARSHYEICHKWRHA